MTKKEAIAEIKGIYFEENEKVQVGNLIITSYCDDEGTWTIKVSDGSEEHSYDYLDWFEDDYEARVDCGIPNINPEMMYEWIAGDFDWKF